MNHSSLLNYSSLKISKLHYHLAGESRIKELSLAVSSGKKVAVLGLNGAGKSTLIRLLLGELAASSGTIEYSQEQQPIHPQDLAFKQQLGYQADTMLAIAELSGASYLKLCASFKQIMGKSLEEQILRIARQWQIEDILEKPMTTLSKGNLQKLSIAQAFLGDPKWLFFDEPCQSLDPVEQVRFNQNIKNLNNFECCFVSTHNVEHALEIADEIILIHRGLLAHHFSLDESHKMLLVLKRLSSEKVQQFEQALSKLEVKIDSRFARVYSLICDDDAGQLALQDFAVEWSKSIEFLLPEKQALMPLFRLLASDELDLVKQVNGIVQGASN